MSKFTERRTPSITKRQAVMDYGYRTGQGGDEDAAVFELPNEDIPTARSAVLYLAHTDFEALGSPEVITVTIEPGGLLNVETDAWPFKPGDVVLDSGEESDHVAWLEAAPERTVVSDCDGDEWTRKNDGLWWMNRGQTARAKSSDLNEQVGPLTVVSVPEATR